MDEKIFTDIPDEFSAEEILRRIETKIIGRKVLTYNIVNSTNTVAFSLAQGSEPEGTAVFAEAQTAGRGRLGRVWVSPKSTAIYLSLVLRPKMLAEEAALITLLAAVSCAETIRAVCGLKALIRWPNDILVNNKKVCGILTEIEVKDNKLEFVILGIGINVSMPIKKLPAGASSLDHEVQSAGAETQFSRIEIARELLRQLDKAYLSFQEQGSSLVITQWRNLSAFSGKRVKVFLANKVIEGQAQDIDEQGALIVRLDNGFKEHLVAGDVVKVR